MAHWLIADDDNGARGAIELMLHIWGFAVVEFNNGIDALDYLDAVDDGIVPDDDLPELALLDIRMPGATGNDVAYRLRESPRLGHIPIIAMTAYHLPEEVQRDLRFRDGVDRIILKPLPAAVKFFAIAQEVKAERQWKNIQE